MSATRLWSQAEAGAQISGVVSDSSGAVVPNARVKATQTATELVRTTLSGSDGNYALPNLPVGSYKLEVQASGFVTYTSRPESFLKLATMSQSTSRCGLAR
ncbi:MAG: carboxypeptidase-like regulatory domain-containing protein [Candidatus Dormibacteraceae bacterium]